MTKPTLLTGVLMSCAVLCVATLVFAQNPPAPAGAQNPPTAKPVGAAAGEITKCPVLNPGALTGAQQPTPAGTQTLPEPSTGYQLPSASRSFQGRMAAAVWSGRAAGNPPENRAGGLRHLPPSFFLSLVVGAR